MDIQDYYWSSGKKIPIRRDKASLFVYTAGDNEKLILFLKQKTLIREFKQKGKNYILIHLNSENVNLINQIKDRTIYQTYSFKTESGGVLIPTGEILLKLKKDVKFEKIQELFKRTIIERNVNKYGVFKISISNVDYLLSISNSIYESGLVEFCHPNFKAAITKSQNDPLYPNQYYLNNTGQFGGTPGIDINVERAWDICVGLNEVKVAVIDDGVENHEDLDGRVMQGFTPTDPNGFGAPEIDGAHGQACAGIIGASLNNNMGIAGIATCTKIIPINIFVGNESINDIADAIDWAWDDGEAEILSNSWGFGEDPSSEFDNIIDAINRARTQGRNNLGSIVIFSSGNSNKLFNGVIFPANIKGVVTVGAIDKKGDIWDYSSRGPEMNLVAPSGNTNGAGDVTTIDRMGSKGYDPGNYTNTFGGTSAAAPQVSGVTSLMLSVNPFLTEQEIVNTLNNTATDMGSVGFDNTFGYGRLNAELALQEVLPKIIGDDFICNGEGFYEIDKLTPNTSIEWSVVGNIVISEVIDEKVTVQSQGNGMGTLVAKLNGTCGSLKIKKQIYSGLPVITAEGYSYNNSQTFPLLPYYSIPNNPVNQLPATVTATFSIKGALSVDAQILSQSDPSITWGVNSGSEQLSFYFDFLNSDPSNPQTQSIVWRVKAESSCGVKTFDVGFYSEI